MKKFLFNKTLTDFVRIFLGLIFFTSGMGKLTHGHFPGLIGPVWLEDELVKYGLGFYARFIAFSQVGIGALMLTRKFSLLATIMMIPMIVNILMVTISLEWRGTPYVVFVFLLMNIYLLITEWPRLKFLICESDNDILKTGLKRKNRKSDLIWLTGFALLIIAPAVYDFNHLSTYILCGIGILIVSFSSVISRTKK